MLCQEKLKFRSSKTAGNAPKTIILLILSLSMGMHPYSGITNHIAHVARSKNWLCMHKISLSSATYSADWNRNNT